MAQTKIKYRQIAGGLDGWIPAEETWTYASADDPTFTFTVAADVTTKYSAGMKIKLTQGTVKYFIITAVSAFSGGNTTITVYGGTDYDLANSAISANYYSMVRSPFGFPMSPAKWQVEATDTSNATQSTPTADTYYNLASLSLTVPIGVWVLSYFANHQVVIAAATATGVLQTTLSTANNSQSDATMTSSSYLAGASATLIQWSPASREKVVSLASKTPYYLNAAVSASSVGSISHRGDRGTTIIRATCAYL